MAKNKVGIIGSVGVPAKYGGFETLAHQLILKLGKQIDFMVYCSRYNYTKSERVATWQGARLKYLPLRANGVQSIFYDIYSILHAAIYCDVLLILGVSGCIFLPFLKLFSKKKIIVNIDGLEWRRAKWSNWIKRFLEFSERIAIRFADKIITDNAALQEYAKEIYGIETYLVEYGADHVQPVTKKSTDLQKYPFLSEKYAFKVSRIEPENSIHLILEAFAILKNFPLVIVGNWSHSAYGKELLAKYEQVPHLHLLAPIYEAEGLNVLRANCSLYIHGHQAGGTNPSLVEAMYLGLPIIASDAIYNQVTTEFSGVYFNTKEQLVAHVLTLSDSTLVSLGHKMKMIADRRYTWSTIAKKYAVIMLESTPTSVPSTIEKTTEPVQTIMYKKE